MTYCLGIVTKYGLFKHAKPFSVSIKSHGHGFVFGHDEIELVRNAFQRFEYGRKGDPFERERTLLFQVALKQIQSRLEIDIRRAMRRIGHVSQIKIVRT